MFPSAATMARAVNAHQCSAYLLTPPDSLGGISYEFHLMVPAARAGAAAAMIKKTRGVFDVRTAPSAAYDASPSGHKSYSGQRAADSIGAHPRPCGSPVRQSIQADARFLVADRPVRRHARGTSPEPPATASRCRTACRTQAIPQSRHRPAAAIRGRTLDIARAASQTEHPPCRACPQGPSPSGTTRRSRPVRQAISDS